MEDLDLVARCDPEKGPDWHFVRRLLILQCLMVGPARRPELIDHVDRLAANLGAVGLDIWMGERKRVLRNDIEYLRDRLGVIEFQRAHQRILEIGDAPLPLLQLAETELHTLANLQRQFRHQRTPHATAARRFFTQLARILLPAQQRLLEQEQYGIDVKQPQNSESIEEQLYNRIAAARGRQRVCFDYRSPRRADGRAVYHAVDPLRLFVRDGHTYLAAYQHEPRPHFPAEGFKEFRLSRIVPASFKVLPHSVQPTPPRPGYLLRYRLTPRVARLKDVNTWFRGSEVVYHADGSAEVTATVKDLWIVEQTLLRYRAECTVLEPAELVERMRNTISKMYRLYQQSPDVADPTQREIPEEG